MEMRDLTQTEYKDYDDLDNYRKRDRSNDRKNYNNNDRNYNNNDRNYHNNYRDGYLDNKGNKYKQDQKDDKGEIIENAEE